MGIILKTATQAITLPEPQDNDTESLEASLQTHVAITGKTRVYSKFGGVRRLTYTLILSLQLAAALETFLNLVIGTSFILIDYQQRRWQVILGSNPVTFNEHARYRVSVTLEFMGILQ